ncbi:MAG: restriction endonuclease [Thermodesulfovibrionales bacterium]
MPSPADRYPPPTLTPEQFELEVKTILDEQGLGLENYRSEHRKVLEGSDGDYEIDVSVRFGALGADFLVLVECKYYKNPVKREIIQSLHSKMQSIGAHKGMVFSTSGFQSGALKFAKAHGIATIHVVDGRSNYSTRSFGPPAEPPPWANIEPIIGWLINGNHRSLVSRQHPEYLRKFLTGVSDES